MPSPTLEMTIGMRRGFRWAGAKYGVPLLNVGGTGYLWCGLGLAWPGAALAWGWRGLGLTWPGADVAWG